MADVPENSQEEAAIRQQASIANILTMAYEVKDASANLSHDPNVKFLDGDSCKSGPDIHPALNNDIISRIEITPPGGTQPRYFKKILENDGKNPMCCHKPQHPIRVWLWHGCASSCLIELLKNYCMFQLN